MDERSAVVNIGGTEYEMLLTTRATKEIAGRYGGLEDLGEKLMKSENFEMADHAFMQPADSGTQPEKPAG